jgi:hypothetical protein
VRALLAVLVLSLAACASNGVHSNDDAWLAPVPHPLVFDREWKKVAKTDVAPVAEARLAEAAARLETASIVALDAAEAERLTGAAPHVSGKAYLVRALAMNLATGGYDVWTRGSALHVHHGCLGGKALPLQRKALVVWLPATPTELYVDVSLAE